MSIDDALKSLSQPREKPETAQRQDDCRSGTNGSVESEHAEADAASSATTIGREGNDADASEEPVSRQGEPQSIGLSDGPITISFCSGALGLDLGLQLAGFRVVLAAETDPDAVETIRANRPGLPVLGDIRRLTAAEVREAAGIGDSDIDLVAAGVPCQAFSTAGRRRGLDDPRGELLLSFANLATELAPKYVLIENVRGLLSDAAFERVLAMLRESGYAVSFHLYDSAYFGAPQRRERVIVIGSRNGSRVPFLTPTHSDRPGDGLPPWKTLRDAIGDMQSVEHHYVEFPVKRLEYFRKVKPGQNWRDLSEEDQQAALSEAVREAKGGKGGFYRRLTWDKPSPTLVTMPNRPATDLCHPDEERPLSVEEYKRIQEFPDEWEVCGDLPSQYGQIGNAVPVLFGQAIGLAIREHMRTQTSDDPVPDFRYSRYSGTGDRDWCGGDTARSRLDEIAPKVRRMTKKTRNSLLVAVRDALPRARKAGRLLFEAKALCRKCRILFEPWVRENCGMSERSAQAYMRVARKWKTVVKAQRSAPLTSIDAFLKFLARPKANGKGGVPDDEQNEESPASPEPVSIAPVDDGGGDVTDDNGRQTEEDEDGREHHAPGIALDEDVLDGAPDAWPDVSVEEASPVVTDAELEAAAAFVEHVGGLPNAARILATKGVVTGDKDVLKDALKEMFRAAQGLVSLAEINETVICLNVTGKGFKAIAP